MKGVRIGTAEAYVRYQNRRDLVIFEFAEGNVAVFSLKMRSRQHLCMCQKRTYKWRIRATSSLTLVMPMQVQARQAC